MEAAVRQEIEAALENKSETTKTYVSECIALAEKYVALMNENRFNLELCQELQGELMEKAESLKAAYLEEREKQGLPPEVGFPRV